MTLSLKTSGRFFGYDAWFDSNGNLVLCFNNPPNVSGSNLSGASIVIDPGHGSSDTGALGFLSSYPESSINYGIASSLASVLRGYGATVTLIPSNSTYYSLAQRVAAAEAADPDLFISVHSNSSSTSSSATGSEAYYFNPWSQTLAQYAAANTASALSTTNRGGKFGYYYVTRTMRYPAILVESGFVSNQTEYHKLIDEDYQDEIAQGLAKAIISYFKAMGAGTVLTGTQSTGSSAADTGSSAQTTSSSSSSSSSSSGSGTLTISDSTLALSVGDEDILFVDWDTDDDYEIVWSVNSAGSSKVKLDPDNDFLTLTALKTGEVQITAQVKGDASTAVTCEVTIE
jgi:N-acetylmuramoyl-L-alanine amidase